EKTKETDPGLTLTHPNSKILLVEDNRVNLVFAQGVLKKLGCKVTTANTGREAVQLYADQVFDMILMDGQMPEMDGFEAARIIREMDLEQGGYTPIVALTAHAMTGDRKKLLDAGMDDYLSKPFTPGQLVNVMNSNFNRKKKPTGV
ncbi:MAG: response regulator, partial [bacterium]|nr:response regulator [bacterium]